MVGGSGPGGKGPGGPGGVGGASGPGSGGVGGSGPGGKGPGGPGGVGGVSGPSPGGTGPAGGGPGAAGAAAASAAAGNGVGSNGDGGGRAANNGGMGSVSNSASPGRSTPGDPSAADGSRGSKMGVSGATAKGVATPATATPSQSISASRQARQAFGMTTTNTRMPTTDEANSLEGVTEGEVASLNQTVLGLVQNKTRAPVSENSRVARQSMATETISPPNIAKVRSLHNDTAIAKLADSRDDGTARNVSEGLIGSVLGLPVGLVADVSDNARAAKAINASREGLAESFGISPDSLGKVTTSDVTSASVGESTNGLIGDTNALSSAINGVASPSVNGPGPTGGRGVDQYEAQNDRQGIPTPSNSNQLSRAPFAGDLNNYGSYRRRFFSRV